MQSITMSRPPGRCTVMFSEGPTPGGSGTRTNITSIERVTPAIERRALVVPPGRTLTEVLNGSLAFVEFQPIDGERMFIAKSGLLCVKPLAVPSAPKLTTKRWRRTPGGNLGGAGS